MSSFIRKSSSYQKFQDDEEDSMTNSSLEAFSFENINSNSNKNDVDNINTKTENSISKKVERIDSRSPPPKRNDDCVKKASSSSNTTRSRSLSLNSGYDKMLDEEEKKRIAQTKKKNKIQKKKKKVVEQPTKSSCSLYTEENINKSRDANYKYLRNSNASPFVKFLSLFKSPAPSQQQPRKSSSNMTTTKRKKSP